MAGRQAEWTDWSAGPPAHVVLSCGDELDYKPPSPAKGDLITCGRCGRSAVVLRPVRRLDRHAPPLAPEDLEPARPARYAAAMVLPSGLVQFAGRPR
jgi:hypothetical protein